MNRFARIGETADPCGVPLLRCTRAPSGRTSGAASHRFTYNSTQRQSVTASTALTTRSHGTSSKEDTTQDPPRWLPADGADRSALSCVGGPLASAAGLDAPPA